MKHYLLGFASLALFLIGENFAQEISNAVSVLIIGISADNVYLDKGSGSGIQIGDQTLFYPAGANPVQASIVSVSQNNSRARLIDPTAQVSIGDRGEVQIQWIAPTAPPSPNSEIPPEKQTTKPPEHPPWTHPPEDWNQNLPLLAPAFGREPSEREPRIYGRIFSTFLNTWDRENTSQRYSIGRVGSEFWAENLFGTGGKFHFRGEYSRRESDLSGANDEIDRELRFQRASYYWGESKESPVRYEVGRFLQNEFPELGVLDGAEIRFRTTGGDRFGFSVGAMPESFPEMKTGDDLQLAAYYRFVLGERENFSLGLAAQKTWHRGDSDRDLLLGEIDLRSDSGLFFHNTSWVDYYTGADDIKNSGTELTETHAQVGYRLSPQHGFSLHYDQIRWPELLRNEFGALLANQVANDRVKRYGASTWHEFWKVLRVDARADAWRDQDDRGNNADLRLGLRNVLFANGELSVGFFSVDGSFTDGQGLRAGLNKFFPFGFLNLSYEIAQYEFIGDSDQDRQKTLHGSLDLNLPRGWNASLFSDYRFGDNQDSISAGLYLQKNF